MGSIGKRHFNNLAEVLSNKNITFKTDVIRSSSRQLDESISKYVNNSYFDIADADRDYDITFVTNPTSAHYQTMKQMVDRTKHMFIEKPAFDDFGYDLSMLNENSIYYVACPLRYSNVISYLKEHLADKKVFAVRAICSSYLPDWRLDVDYRTVYSAKKSLGGGVSLDLIHELDYITYLFGMPLKVKNMQGKYSELEIDSEDVSIYMLEYKDKLVSLHLDYFGRTKKREIEIFTEDDVVVGDLVNNKITMLTTKKSVNFAEVRDDYQIKELEHFIDIINGKAENSNNILHANEILKMAKG